MNDSVSISFSAFVADIRDIIYKGKNTAISSVNSVMIATYWNIGKRIVEEEQQGKSRADYGKRLIEALAYELSNEFGSGFSKRYLAYFRKFYISFPDLKILQTRLQNLRWSHIITALRVDDVTARRWYLENAASQMWSVRTLNRNISTQYYERHFQTPEATTSNITDSPQACEILKSPFIAEFLGFKQDESINEKSLESSIITHLKEFLMELGKGFAFMGRQQHIRTDAEDYFIDLVFYNVILKCYVLIDLKIGKITHQDVGQMDMYVKMYDELKRTSGDNPTIGVVLCSETDSDIAKYSILNGNQQLFATKYKLYMPTEEQLRKEIIHQKELFKLQHQSDAKII